MPSVSACGLWYIGNSHVMYLFCHGSGYTANKSSRDELIRLSNCLVPGEHLNEAILLNTHIGRSVADIG